MPYRSDSVHGVHFFNQFFPNEFEALLLSFRPNADSHDPSGDGKLLGMLRELLHCSRSKFGTSTRLGFEEQKWTRLPWRT